jgi:2-aminoethylphosphonate-pyruvate transaminase
MVGSLVPTDGHLLVLVNGAYGHRLVDLAERRGRRVSALAWPEDQPVDPEALSERLAQDPSVTHVAVVYCETTSGVLNPLAEVARRVAVAGRRLLVDAMSAFGALPLTLDEVPFDAVAASANKCLEGVPGLGFVLARREVLAAAGRWSSSLSLDLVEQAARLEKDGQYRFTPPTHVLLALHEALSLYAAEGGVRGRGDRYRANAEALCAGLRARGFRLFLAPAHQAPIIVTVWAPTDPAWRFPEVYARLVEAGFAIYPGKLTEGETFRVGCIGQVFPDDIRRFLAALDQVMAERGVRLPSVEGGVG